MTDSNTDTDTTPFSSLDTLLETLYATISGPAGADRDWELERKLFHPTARMMRTGVHDDGTPWVKVMSMEEYITDVDDFLKEKGFFEWQTDMKVDRFGNIAQVFSTYAASHEENGEVIKRGINSIQCYYDGHRWWIMNMIWDNERPGNPMP
ncbi:MAG: hypothetical protein ACQETE_12245 [Bacteroidota bacterium]